MIDEETGSYWVKYSLNEDTSRAAARMKTQTILAYMRFSLPVPNDAYA